jgi:hypothetical protein
MQVFRIRWVRNARTRGRTGNGREQSRRRRIFRPGPEKTAQSSITIAQALLDAASPFPWLANQCNCSDSQSLVEQAEQLSAASPGRNE